VVTVELVLAAVVVLLIDICLSSTHLGAAPRTPKAQSGAARAGEAGALKPYRNSSPVRRRSQWVGIWPGSWLVWWTGRIG
jgi:hypothetical protein